MFNSLRLVSPSGTRSRSGRVCEQVVFWSNLLGEGCRCYCCAYISFQRLTATVQVTTVAEAIATFSGALYILVDGAITEAIWQVRLGIGFDLRVKEW